MSSPTVSVIIPCFNKGNLVEEAAACALGLDWPRLEVIIVNDGSTDPQTLASLGTLRKDARLVVIDQENAGLSAARNTGMARMTGDFVLFLDHDDLVSAGYVRAAVEHLQTHPETAYAYPDIIFFGERRGLKPAGPFDRQRLACDNFIPCSCVHRSEAVRGLAFDPALPALEDWDFLLSLLDQDKAGAPLHGQYLYYRIIAATSMTVRHSDRRRRDALIRRIRAKHGIRLSLLQLGRYYLGALLGPALQRRIRQAEARRLAQARQAAPELDRELHAHGIA